MSSAEPMLRFEALSVGYRRQAPLLQAASGCVRPGQLIALVGLNGSGKTTLLRTLAGLYPPLAGNLWWQGQTQLTPRTRARLIASVLPTRSIPPLITVEEAVALGRYPFQRWLPQLLAEDRAAISEAVRLTGIRHLLQRRLSKLSDGEGQRVRIAQALAQTTPLLLLDEPTAHLDPRGRREITQLLQTLAKETHKGIVYATHELELALQTSDRIWVLQPARTLSEVIPAALAGTQALEVLLTPLDAEQD